MTTLIERLNERAHDPKRATDEGQGPARPPATEAQIAAAEAHLGFRLPALLRTLYAEVGNGNFGPGHGLFGVPTSPADRPGSVVGHYPADKTWPAGLLPVCDWGSGILSCLDCLRPEAPVVRLDPNMPKADVAARVPAALHYDKAARVPAACWVESESLEEWLEAWANGGRLFYAAYGGTSDVADDEDWGEEEDEEEDA